MKVFQFKSKSPTISGVAFTQSTAELYFTIQEFGHVDEFKFRTVDLIGAFVTTHNNLLSDDTEFQLSNENGAIWFKLLNSCGDHERLDND